MSDHLSAEGLATPHAMAELRAQSYWRSVNEVALQVEVRIEMPMTCLTELAALQAGQVLRSAWPTGEEVPLLVHGVTLSWCEFDVLDGRIAIRLTRLA